MRKISFDSKSTKWMEAGVFSNSMSVLAIGSPLKYLVVGRDLRQGGTLSPFLFSIVVEGLVGQVKQTMNDVIFKGFQVIESMSYNLLLSW